MKIRATRRRAALGAMTVLVTALSACGGTSQGSSGGKADEATIASYQADLQHWYDGTYKEPEAPAIKPPADKNVWVVSSGLGIEYSVRLTEAVKEAGASLGWKVHVYDAKFDPNQMLTGVQQAVVAHADGIIAGTIDCSIVTNAAKQAAEAGIPIVGVETQDCNPGLYDHVVSYAGKESLDDWLMEFGKAQAAWVIAQTKGEAKAVVNTETDSAATRTMSSGVTAQFKECPTCAIVDDATFVAADFGPKLQEKIQQGLTKHPDANAFIPSFDAAMTQSGGAQAVKSTGRLAQLAIAGGEGSAAGIEQIRSGQGMEMCVGQSAEWEAYSALDALARIFLDRDPSEADTGNGLQICDKDHNLPAKGKTFTPPVDFAKSYLELWGLG